MIVGASTEAPVIVSGSTSSHTPSWVIVVGASAGGIQARGRILVAPPDNHLIIQDGFVRLGQGPRLAGLVAEPAPPAGEAAR